MKLIIISLLLCICSCTKLNNLFKALNNMNEFLIFEEVVSRYKRPEFEGLHINATYDEVLKYFKNTTNDKEILDAYQTVFNADFSLYQDLFNVNDSCINTNKSFYSTEQNNDFKSMNISNRSNSRNFETLKYFVHAMSMIVEGIPDPYYGESQNLKTLLNNSVQDDEQRKFDKLDYLQLMNFWEEYLCIKNQIDNEKILDIQSDYLAFLSTILYIKDKNQVGLLHELVMLNSECKLCGDNLKMFLNPTKTARNYFYQYNGMHRRSPSINEFEELKEFYSIADSISLDVNETLLMKEHFIHFDEIEPDDLIEFSIKYRNHFNTSADLFEKYRKYLHNRELKRENKLIYGKSETGFKRDINLSCKYFKEAAERGSNVAKYNLGLLYQETNSTLAFNYMKDCAKKNFTTCYLGLGKMYLNGIGVEKNVEKAINHLEKAIEGEHYEAASVLAHIYLSEPQFINKTLGYQNLDYALRDPNNMNAKLMIVAYYYENSVMLVSNHICNRILSAIHDLQYINEVEDLYQFGYSTLLISENLTSTNNNKIISNANQALMIFSFGALLGHHDSILAAAKLWESNKNISLKCKFGSNLVCASYYYFQLMIKFNDAKAGVKAADLMSILSKDTDNFYWLSKEKIFKIYNHYKDQNSKAKYKVAYSYYIGEGVEQNKTKAIEIWNSLALDAWTGSADIRNLLPSLFARFYIDIFESY